MTYLASTREEGRIRARITGLTATCFSLVLLTGCGGTSDQQATGVGDEFASKALAVCAAALKDKHDWQPFPVADFDPSDRLIEVPRCLDLARKPGRPDLPHVMAPG